MFQNIFKSPKLRNVSFKTFSVFDINVVIGNVDIPSYFSGHFLAASISNGFGLSRSWRPNVDKRPYSIYNPKGEETAYFTFSPPGESISYSYYI